MSLFNEPVKTQAEIAKDEVREMNAMVERITELSKTFSEKLFNHFWFNPYATPQELVAIYGTDGYKLFEKLSVWNSAINNIDPTFIPKSVPSKWDYKINQDGSVTITEKVVPVEPPVEPPVNP